jgi:hypothetical protein
MLDDDVTKLREHRFHLKYILDNIELLPDIRVIFAGLLKSVEERIADNEGRKTPN